MMLVCDTPRSPPRPLHGHLALGEMHFRVCLLPSFQHFENVPALGNWRCTRFSLVNNPWCGGSSRIVHGQDSSRPLAEVQARPHPDRAPPLPREEGRALHGPVQVHEQPRQGTLGGGYAHLRWSVMGEFLELHLNVGFPIPEILSAPFSYATRIELVANVRHTVRIAVASVLSLHTLFLKESQRSCRCSRRRTSRWRSGGKTSATPARRGS